MSVRVMMVWLLLVTLVSASVGCAPPAGAKKKGLSTSTGNTSTTEKSK